ncbi:hypothetical protein U1Q18_036289, partial [Sarracenia purpurea var. burkii]
RKKKKEFLSRTPKSQGTAEEEEDEEEQEMKRTVVQVLPFAKQSIQEPDAKGVVVSSIADSPGLWTEMLERKRHNKR